MPSSPIVPVIAGLYANTCPLCGRHHRSCNLHNPTAIMVTHAAKLETRGYLGYDYGREQWVTAVVVAEIPAVPSEQFERNHWAIHDAPAGSCRVCDKVRAEIQAGYVPGKDQ